jgi:dihydrofolate reductase
LAELDADQGGRGRRDTQAEGGPGKDIQVIGSGELAQTLIQNDLVDVYAIAVHPIVLGSGKRLFPEGGVKRPLRLVDSKTTSTGVLILTYEPVRG